MKSLLASLRKGALLAVVILFPMPVLVVVASEIAMGSGRLFGELYALLIEMRINYYFAIALLELSNYIFFAIIGMGLGLYVAWVGFVIMRLRKRRGMRKRAAETFESSSALARAS